MSSTLVNTHSFPILLIAPEQQDIDTLLLSMRMKAFQCLSLDALFANSFVPSLFETSKNVYIITDINRAKTSKQPLLLEWMKSEIAYFVLIAEKEVSSEITAFFKKQGQVYDFRGEKSWDKEARKVEWLISYLKEKRLTLSQPLALRLVREFGHDMLLLSQELEKLVDYMGPFEQERTVSEKDLHAIVFFEGGASLWDLSDSFMQRQPHSSLQVLCHLIKQEVHPLVIVRHLRTAVHQSLMMQQLFRSGKQVAEHFPQLKGKLFDKTLARAKNTPFSFLTHSLYLLDEAEFALKDSVVDPETVVFRSILGAML